MLSPSIVRRMREVRLFAMDVDGVLTDGAIPYARLGDEWADARRFDVKDGLAIAQAIRAGLECAIITSKTGEAVRRRCEHLGVSAVAFGREDKAAALCEALEARGLDGRQAAFVGDDLFDLPALAMAGLAIAPRDAAPEVVRQAHFVTAAPGGAGCVREALRAILIVQHRWADIVRAFSTGGAEPSAS